MIEGSQPEEVYQNCIKSYLKEIKDLKSLLSENTKRDNLLKESNREISEKYEKCSLELKKREERILYLEKYARECSQKINSIEKDAKEHIESINQKYDLEKNQLQMEKSGLINECTKLKSFAEESIQNLERYAKEIIKQREMVVASTDEQGKLQRELIKMKTLLIEKDLTINNVISENTSLKEQIRDSSRQNTELEAQNTETTAIISDLNTKVDQFELLSQQMEEMSGTLQKVMEERSILQIELAKSEASRIASDEMIQTLQDSYSGMSIEDEHNIDISSEIQGVVQQMNNKHQKLKSKYRKLKSKYQDLVKQHVFTLDELQECNELISKERQQFSESLALTYKHHRLQIDEISNRITRSKDAYKTDLNTLSEKQFNRTENAISDDSFQELNSRYTQLMLDFQSLSEKSAKSSYQLEKTKHVLSDLQKQYQMSESKLFEKENVISELKKSNNK